MSDRLKILLVEDDSDHAELIRRKIRRSKSGHDAQVVVASTLAKARQRTADETFDAVILDLGLPDGGGTASLREFAPVSPTLPIVVLSSLEEATWGRVAIGLGAQDFLEKDAATGDSLMRSVHYAIERKKQTEQLARKNESLLAFTRMASHDLRGPLRRMTSLTTMVEHAAADRLTEEQHGDLDYIHQSADRLLHLVDELLRFARLEEAALELEAFPLAEAVDAAIELLGPEQREFVQVGESPTVVADQVLLTSVMQNLIGNALKYVDAAEPRVVVAAEVRGDRVVVSVADNGVGVPPDDLQRIFEPLQRADATQGREGSGMGLAICRRIVEAHGGEIAVQSQPDHGSTFTFYLPLQSAANTNKATREKVSG